MKVELSEQDIINTVEFLNRAPLKGAESVAMAMLIQRYKIAVQPEETLQPEGSDNGAAPKGKRAQAK